MPLLCGLSSLRCNKISRHPTSFSDTPAYACVCVSCSFPGVYYLLAIDSRRRIPVLNITRAEPGRRLPISEHIHNKNHDYSLDADELDGLPCTDELYGEENAVESDRESYGVTVGIGVLCEECECVILASDLRLSIPHTIIGPHDKSGKQWDLPLPFTGGVSVAGTMWCVQRYLDESHRQLWRLCQRKKFSRRQLEDTIDRARVRVHWRMCNMEMRRVLEIGLKQWQTGKIGRKSLNPLLLRQGLDVIRSVTFPVASITAGFLNQALIWYRTDGLRNIQSNVSPGYFVIGTGAQYAIKHLAWRGQTPDNRLQSSLLHVYEAMRRARTDRAVGPPADYMVMWSDGRVERFPAESALLRGWAKHYKRRESTASLDSSMTAKVQMDNLFRAHQLRNPPHPMRQASQQ